MANNNISAIILSDHRENNGAIPYMSNIVIENNKSCKLTMKMGGGEILHSVVNNQTVGDYAIMLPNKDDPSQQILAAVFERKTWKDLAGSIKDGRCNSQFANMIKIRDEQGCFVYYIIEGRMLSDNNGLICRVPAKALKTKMRTMSLRGIHSFRTKNAEDTAIFLVKMARDLKRLYMKGDIQFEKQIDMSINIVPNVLTTRCIKSNNDILARMWQCFPFVSSQLSAQMIERFDIGQFICALSANVNDINDINDINEIKDTISNIKYSSGVRVGPARAAKIMSAIQNKDSVIIYCQKILAEIPSVTLPKAEAILNHFDYIDLFSGNVNERELGEIRFNGRRLMAVAKKIIQILTPCPRF